jgi:tetratricopeptide (TPR) repeat protein
MKDTDLFAIEQTIEKYPWYSLAHLELFKGLSELGDEQREAYLYKAAAYLYSRGKLYDIAFPAKRAANKQELAVSYQEPEKVTEENILIEENSPGEITLENDLQEPSVSGEPVKVSAEDETGFEFIFDIDDSKELPHKVIIAGGDYFSRNDFETIELDKEMPLDRFIVEKPSLLRASVTSRDCPATFDPAEIDASELFDDSGFYTETLARIYTSQGFYKRALDVYAKLILLYPEKSAYFATLVKELKTKHNT